MMAHMEAMLDTQDFEGRTVRGEIGKDATGNFDTRPQRTIDSFFEIHIEQGPVLEVEGIPIGIVAGAYAQRWYDVTIEGFESHAGPTPMPYRKDALVAGAEVILAVEQSALSQPPDGRGTVGTLSLEPFSRNVIPGSVKLTIDTRHSSEDELWHSPMRPFDAELIQSLEQAAKGRGFETLHLASGAGHDAVYMASIGIPTAMLFVPTKDGISHNESESITREDAIAGCQVLCDAVVERLFAE